MMTYWEKAREKLSGKSDPLDYDEILRTRININTTAFNQNYLSKIKNYTLDHFTKSIQYSKIFVYVEGRGKINKYCYFYKVNNKIYRREAFLEMMRNIEYTEKFEDRDIKALNNKKLFKDYRALEKDNQIVWQKLPYV